VAESDQEPLHPAFVEILRADRDSLNQRFTLQQRAGARIEEAAFQQHLRTTVNTLVAAVARAFPERVRAVAGALFDVSLDLFAAGLLGPEPKHPHVAAAWREVLPQATRLLARDPRRLAGALSNAVDHLAASSSARPAQWIELMKKLSPECADVPLWLEAGKVAAWRAGLVQYREAALPIARALPRKLALPCLGVSPGLPDADWQTRLDRLENDRWYSPATDKPEDASRYLRIVRATGGFRGFGGPCLRPPAVTIGDGLLFVSDGEASWQLLADVFGTCWQRIPKCPARDSAGVEKITIDSHGGVSWNGTRHKFSELAEPSSFACDGQTLAVTLPTSHLVFLVGQVGRPQ
jgi:hypothetical protein